MKPIIICISTALFFVNCEPRVSIKPTGATFGFFIAKMNGKPWTKIGRKGGQATRGFKMNVDTTLCQNKYYVITSELYNGKDNFVQYIFFEKFPLVPGKYKLTSNLSDSCNIDDQIRASFNTMVETDMIGDQYKVLASEDNYLHIEKYDPKSKDIRGSFQVTFVFEKSGYRHTLPDTMRFTDGRYLTKMMDLRRK
jgi:hypothetical protein